MNSDARAIIAEGLQNGFNQTELARFLGISRQRVWQLANPEKHSAHEKLTEAILRGHIIVPIMCQECLKVESRKVHIEAHHDDYSKPLEVRWLCQKCHREADKAMRLPVVLARARDRKVEIEQSRARKETEKSELRQMVLEARLVKMSNTIYGLYKQLGRVPTYQETASAVKGRYIDHNKACPTLAGVLGVSARPRYWDYVKQAYQLAGLQPRGKGVPGHVQRKAAV